MSHQSSFWCLASRYIKSEHNWVKLTGRLGIFRRCPKSNIFPFLTKKFFTWDCLPRKKKNRPFFMDLFVEAPCFTKVHLTRSALFCKEDKVSVWFSCCQNIKHVVIFEVPLFTIKKVAPLFFSKRLNNVCKDK